MSKLFRDFCNVISNVAQIVLYVILLPFAAIIFSLIPGSGQVTGNVSDILAFLIGNILPCEKWVEIIKQYTDGSTAAVLQRYRQNVIWIPL